MPAWHGQRHPSGLVSLLDASKTRILHSFGDDAPDAHGGHLELVIRIQLPTLRQRDGARFEVQLPGRFQQLQVRPACCDQEILAGCAAGTSPNVSVGPIQGEYSNTTTYTLRTPLPITAC